MNYTFIEMMDLLTKQKYTIVSDDKTDLLRVLVWFKKHGFKLSVTARSMLETNGAGRLNPYLTFLTGVAWLKQTNSSGIGIWEGIGTGLWDASRVIPYKYLRHIFEGDEDNEADPVFTLRIPQPSSDEELIAFLGF